MTQIILDAEAIKKLHNLTQRLQLCDETGKVLAELTPVLDPNDYEPAPPPEMSTEELQRRFNSTKWHTTAEVIAHLENL